MDEQKSAAPKKPLLAPVLAVQALILFVAFIGSSSFAFFTLLAAPVLLILQAQAFLQANPISRRFNPLWLLGTVPGLLLGFLKGHDPYFPAIAALYLLPHLFFVVSFLARTPKSGVVASASVGFALSFAAFAARFAVRNFPLQGEEIERDMAIVADMLRSLPVPEQYSELFSSEAFITLLSQLVRLLPGFFLAAGVWISLFSAEILQSFWIRTGAVRFRFWRLRPNGIGGILAILIFLAARIPWGSDFWILQITAENLDLFFNALFFFSGVSLFLERRERAGREIRKTRVFLIFLISLLLGGVSTLLSYAIRLVYYAAYFWGVFHSVRTLFRKDETKNS